MEWGRMKIRCNVNSVAAAALCAAALVSVTAAGGAFGADSGSAASATQNTSGKPMQAEPFSHVPADVKAEMIAQQPYSAAAKKIQVSIFAAGPKTGFAGIALGEDAVELWWKGRIPAQVQRTVDSVRRRVPVQIKPAKYSRVELKVEAARLSAAMRKDPASSLHMVQIPVDGSHLTAVYDKGAGIAVKSTLTTSKSVTAQSVPIKKAGIPIVTKEAERVALADRFDDGELTGTYSGGARIINNDVDKGCTSGFGVRSGSQRYLLTAGHCGRVGGSFDNGNRTRRIGTASNENVAHDLLLIPASTDHYIWDGGATSNNFVKTVIGWDWARGNELVCQSGATSGAVCGIRNNTDYTATLCGDDIYRHRECYNDLISANRAAGLACRLGDSGAPVFALASGEYQVIAKGTVTGCGDVSGMVYQDFGTAYRDFNIVPIG
jgi:streptogrisin D